MSLLRSIALGAVLGTSLGACSHASPFIRSSAHPVAAEAPSEERILQRLILIGDAGEPRPEGESVLRLLHDTAASLPERTVVVFLGDNIYPAGLPAIGADGRAAAEAALDVQIAAVGPARGIFVPGNHDWESSGAGGLDAILRQGAYVSAHPRIEISPTGGCAGPVAHELESVRLITLDTQWWLHRHDKGGPACTSADTASALRALDRLLDAPPGVEVVVAGHHPLRTRGPHDGFHTAAEWIFPSLMADDWRRWLLLPLPLLGPSIRWLVRSDQDFRGPRNQAFRSQLGSALRRRPPFAYVAGHEHSLQIFDGLATASLLLVSGAGSPANATPVGDDPETFFAHAHPGFMVLDFLEDEVVVRVIEPDTPDPVPFGMRSPRTNPRR